MENQEFLDFLKSLQPIAPNLNKLSINIGKIRLNNKEGGDLLDSLKNIKNIRSLKLHGLILSSKLFFANFIGSISRLLLLRSLTFNEISGKIPQGMLADSLKRLLQKRGLQKLCCDISQDLQPLLQESFQPTSIKGIRRRNPSLIKAPYALRFHEVDIGF